MYHYLASVVGNISTHEKKGHSTYEASDFVNDNFPCFPYLLKFAVIFTIISNIALKYDRLSQDYGNRVTQLIGNEQWDRKEYQVNCTDSDK